MRFFDSKVYRISTQDKLNKVPVLDKVKWYKKDSLHLSFLFPLNDYQNFQNGFFSPGAPMAF